MTNGANKGEIMLPAKRGKIKANIIRGIMKSVIKLTSTAGERVARIRGSSGGECLEAAPAPPSSYMSKVALAPNRHEQ
ncbi:hypothetical protein ACHQM5_021675 [Ranunculus cassubicifolius]